MEKAVKQAEILSFPAIWPLNLIVTGQVLESGEMEHFGPGKKGQKKVERKGPLHQ